MMDRAAWFLLIMCAGVTLTCNAATGAEVRLINGFEDEAELADWQFAAGSPRLTPDGATEGAMALEVTFDPGGEWFPVSLFWSRVVRDWTPYDALVVDVLNPNNFAVAGNVLVADQAWADRGRSYWNRHNGTTTFAPGRGQWVIPVRGLYRGEAGSRNNDIKSDIDPASIVRLDLNFGSKGETGRIIIDNLRFITVDKAEGVWAFDFGPPSQPVMPGWTPVSNETVYSPERGYGWGPEGGSPWPGAARDTTFGTMLTQDFCEAGGYSFRVDVPAGTYSVLVIYDNCGYWGGEQAMHTSRGILVDGVPVWSEQRPDGPATALYRFEELEPVGADLWDAYMQPEITRPARFQAQAGPAGVTLQFRADRVWGSRVSALALHRTGDDAAAQWLSAQMDAVRDEFRSKAVCLDPPPAPLPAHAGWTDRGLVAWVARIEDEVTPGSAPTTLSGPGELRLVADAVRGEYEPLCLVVRPLRDLGDCRVFLDPGPGFPDATVSMVWYGTSRGFGSIAYRVRPHTLRPAGAVDLKQGVAREFVVTVATNSGTPAGTYEARLVVATSDGSELLSVPVAITVHDVVLSRDTDFLMGFFGLEPPEVMLPPDAWSKALEATLVLLREHGMNALSGGPSFRLAGWQGGQPLVDFGDCDSFFALCRRHGFDKAINGYGGLRFLGLHDGYQKGDAAERVEQESGLDYETALIRAWAAVHEHARANDWPTIYYAMCDETRVRDVAERELEFMRLMAKVSARFPETVRTSGAYSVDFRSRPTDEDDMTFWHQRFFEALDVSSLNLHDESVMAEAARLGKEVHVYNQGTSRYSFGLYQWSEYQKGVRARWQWHLNILHGYQFFDLDGREPDTAMICYGRNRIYPTIEFERCREGAEDFYLYQMLARLVEANEQAGRKPAETKAAAELMEGLAASVALDQRDAPADYNPYTTKIEVIRAIQAAL